MPGMMLRFFFKSMGKARTGDISHGIAPIIAGINAGVNGVLHFLQQFAHHLRMVTHHGIKL